MSSTPSRTPFHAALVGNSTTQVTLPTSRIFKRSLSSADRTWTKSAAACTLNDGNDAVIPGRRQGGQHRYADGDGSRRNRGPALLR